MKTNTKQSEIKNTAQKSNIVNNKNSKDAELIVLKPYGYPFDFTLAEDQIKITNAKLFEDYARDQWLGLVVKKDSFLFDQKIIPDYAFEVVTAEPDNSIITENTNIKIITDDIRENNDLNPIKTDVKFCDVVGQVNAKNKIKVIERYIENPELFGQWCPKNILFWGLPGTGKTMLVKALASKSDIPMYLVKATSLIGEHVGDASSRIHDLFEKASKNSPSIVFIDEIDAIALHRSFQSLRGDVSEVVNSLLTELDGIEDNDAVITIGATNNPESLDYAVRSRFEEEIEFKLPDDNERKELFAKNLETLPLEHDLNINKLVNLSKNMSGRDIKEKILKTALHHAIANDKDIVTMSDIEYAVKASKIKNSDVNGMFE